MFGGNYLLLENLASDSINFMPDVRVSQPCMVVFKDMAC